MVFNDVINRTLSIQYICMLGIITVLCLWLVLSLDGVERDDTDKQLFIFRWRVLVSYPLFNGVAIKVSTTVRQDQRREQFLLVQHG